MKLHTFSLLITFFAFTGVSFGSFEHRSTDARVEAMGGAGTALSNPPFGPLYNPASGASGNTSSAGISYALPFGKSSFDIFHGSFQTATLPFDKNGSIGISWQHYGSSRYNETCTYAFYSTIIAEKIRAGISAGILQKDSALQGSSSAPGINLGVLASLSPSLNVGASVFNLNRVETGPEKEKAPLTTFAGMMYKPGKNIVFSAAVEKHESYDARLRTGGEYTIFSFLSLRAGFSTAPSTFTGGAGIIAGRIRGDLAFVRHPELGTGSWYTMRISF